MNKKVKNNKASLKIEFELFHASNPSIYRELHKMAKNLQKLGRKSYGMKSLFEVLRWHSAMNTSGDVYKLCNNHTAFYARAIMDRDKSLRGFFRLRKQTA